MPAAASIRRANLSAYLEARRNARVMLVGEAMGYRGGRFSGIAFTSERTLAAWGRPFAATSRRPDGWAEPSATIVHGAIADREDDVVLWNVVPAHPHHPDRPLSNRTPTAAEIAAGSPFLDAAIALVRPGLVVAVGRVGERLLGERADGRVRHPAQGGATAFREGIAQLLAS
jgi:uracil-DNA glycosylase